MDSEYIALGIERKRNFKVNSSVYLDMLLPIEENEYHIAIDAIITKIEKILDGYKMVLVCNYVTKDQVIIEKYMARRQHEIIKEIS